MFHRSTTPAPYATKGISPITTRRCTSGPLWSHNIMQVLKTRVHNPINFRLVLTAFRTAATFLASILEENGNLHTHKGYK
jgi:hypothetical protein